MANVINPDELLIFEYPRGIRRQEPFPLDNKSLFTSTEKAKKYALSDGTAYAGQIITVVEPDEAGVNQVKLFLITDKKDDNNVLQGIATGNYVPVEGGAMTGNLTLQMNEVNGEKVGGTLYSRMIENSNTATSKIFIATQHIEAPDTRTNMIRTDTIKSYQSDRINVTSEASFQSSVEMQTLYAKTLRTNTLTANDNSTITITSQMNISASVTIQDIVVKEDSTFSNVLYVKELKGINFAPIRVTSSITFPDGGDISGISTNINVQEVHASSHMTAQRFNINGEDTSIYREDDSTELLTLYAEKGFNFKSSPSYKTVFNMPVDIKGSSLIELATNLTTPYINFHYNNAASYTSRLIESTSGKLTCSNHFNVQGSLYIYGNSNSNGCFLKAETSVGTNYLRMHGGNIELSSQGYLSLRTNQAITRNAVYSTTYTSIKEWKFMQDASLQCPGQVQAVSFYATSDKRLKENIKLYSSTSSILDIPLYEYDLISTQEHTLGIMAQDLQEKFPMLVKEDDKGYLSINENKLVYLLMEEVKKLKEEIKEMKGIYG